MTIEPILGVIVLAVVVVVIAAPLRRGDAGGPPPADDAGAMEAARDAALREILDTELDYRTGKLSEADYRELDRQLRAEAIALRRAEDAP